jgi:hypothetical protein
MDDESNQRSSSWAAAERIKWYKDMKNEKKIQQKRNSKLKHKDEYNERQTNKNRNLSENKNAVQKRLNRLKKKLGGKRIKSMYVSTEKNKRIKQRQFPWKT